ncbi:tyrosine-type recombinase/integrase [Burkholderia sp. Bp8963]|uniref:tyrosine-type recombinase/integrase n=1 Tax=Burkholderia sp. Bp8963 TaxID=2184547 RepID=UPI001639C130|nr:tyrosine-type recombinase/integrase [Burkholderia sp. Bp8963]
MIFDRYREMTCCDGNALAYPDAGDELPPLPFAEARNTRSCNQRFRYAFHPSMSARLLGRYQARVLSDDDAWRQTLAPSDLHAARADLVQREQALIDDIALDNVNNAWKSAAELLKLEGVDSTLASMAAMQSFVNRYLRNELDLIRIRIARLNGADIPTPQLPPGALDEDEWAVMQATWEAARVPKPASRYEAALAVKRLRECIHDKSPCDLTLADAMLFRTSLLSYMSRGRAKSSLSLVRSILKTAAAEYRVPLNVSMAFESVKIEVSEKSVHSFQPFSVSQLQAFFDGPVHSRGLRPAKGGRDAAFWVPLLALFEGMRLEEAGSLVCGALSPRSGRYWLRIGRSKTAAGLREIPLHRELERLGFVEYFVAQQAGRTATEPLFLGLRYGSKENQTHMFSTWVNEYIDKHVVDEAAYVFHSFRNSFEDAATAAGVPEDVRRALMGHAQVAMTRRYGKKDGRNRRIFPDQALIEAIDKVCYQGLDLSHVIRMETGL